MSSLTITVDIVLVECKSLETVTFTGALVIHTELSTPSLAGQALVNVWIGEHVHSLVSIERLNQKYTFYDYIYIDDWERISIESQNEYTAKMIPLFNYPLDIVNSKTDSVAFPLFTHLRSVRTRTACTRHHSCTRSPPQCWHTPGHSRLAPGHTHQCLSGLDVRT